MLINSRCQLVECSAEGLISEGPVQCVQHSHCEEIANSSYACECDTGYVRDGEVTCIGQYNGIHNVLVN